MVVGGVFHFCTILMEHSVSKQWSPWRLTDDDSADIRVVQYIDDVDHNVFMFQRRRHRLFTLYHLIYSGTLFCNDCRIKIRAFNCTLSRGDNKQTCFLIIFTLIKSNLLSDPGP